MIDLDADARVATGRADADVPIFVGVEVLRMRVEIADHAADRAFEKFGVVERLDVIALDAFEHFGEQPGLLPGQLFLVRRRLFADQSATEGQAETEHTADNHHQNCTNFQ